MTISQMPDSFLDSVRDFLLHLHDYAFLQSSPLVKMMSAHEPLEFVQAMRSMRALLLTTLEQLKPSTNVPFRAPQARTYWVLKLHYVERLTILEVALELAISERTIYRELRKAEHDLAVLLYGNRQIRDDVGSSSETNSVENGHILLEASRIEQGVQSVEIGKVIQGVLGAVDRLSQLRKVSIRSLSSDWSPAQAEDSGADGDQLIRVDPLLLRQILINALSHLIQNCASGATVAIGVQPDAQRARIVIDCFPPPQLHAKELFPSVAQQLTHRLDGVWSSKLTADGHLLIELCVGGRSNFVILVIDDNENLIELFRRYLADERCSVIGARDGIEGLQLAEQSVPDLVILDVMMPQHDGWEVLQWFQSHAHTLQIPVLICSVVNDPELALSLGASGFMAKPVARQELLTTLSHFRENGVLPSHQKVALSK